MATSAPVAPKVASNAQFCDYCHQKPKFSNHSYCSKHCASQAATLCNHCHKKPKFQNFEYCGKNCAALANPGGKGARSGGPAPVVQPAGGGGKATFYSKGVNSQQAAPTFDPVQLAKLVAQHIPQVQAMLAPMNGQGQQSAPQAASYPSGPFGGALNHSQAMPPSSNINPNANGYQGAPTNPFLGGIPATQQNIAGSSNSTGMQSYAGNVSNSCLNSGSTKDYLRTNNAQQATDNLECLIPGCGKPVHVDAKGVKTSDYCSMRHREEAVTSGLVSPCIMCLVMPQSDADYFCSRACKDESMSKHMEYYDDEETLVSE